MQYDLLNRLTEIQWNKKSDSWWGTAEKIEEELAYDSGGNPLVETREFGRLSYAYDPTNQLSSVVAQGSGGQFDDKVLSLAFSRDYEYDLKGNRTLAYSNSEEIRVHQQPDYLKREPYISKRC
jgi:hypothetical protein